VCVDGGVDDRIPWFVTVEGHQGEGWTVVCVYQQPTYRDATAMALDVARRYTPPFSIRQPRHRWIMRIHEDSMMVILTYRYLRTHFRVDVGQQVL
jgi:hypothetical protein